MLFMHAEQKNLLKKCRDQTARSVVKVIKAITSHM